MSYNEFKMCLDAKNANDKIQSPEVKIPKCLQVIDSYFRGMGDALFNSVSPFKVDTSTGQHQKAYDNGSKAGDTIVILSLLWSVMSGGGLQTPKAPVVAGGSGGSVAVAIDGSAVSGLYGASGFSDVEDEIKKLQEGIKKNEKGETGGKNKGGSKTKVEVPKSVERQVKKLSPEAKKGYDKAVDALKNGNTQGLNEHPLSGDRKGQWAVDMKGTGKGRGKGRIIYEKGKDGTIKIIEILTDHNYY